jgi:putative transposase
MIDRGNVLPLTRQASLLQLSRSSVYYLPRPVPQATSASPGRSDSSVGSFGPDRQP